MDKKKEKTTYWLITVIGFLSIGFSLYSFIKGKDFASYFSGGLLGLIFLVLGINYLLKEKKEKV